MLSKEIKAKILNEKNIDKALNILRENKIEELDEDIIKHLQEITPKDEIPIGEFSYIRKNK